jgi:hypothetical protein
VAYVDSWQDAPSASPTRRVTVPSWPGQAACAVSVVALALLIWRPGTPAYVIGYLLGAIAGPVLAVAYRFVAENRRKDPWFVRTSGPSRLVLVSVLAGIAIGLGHAWLLATELAKV